MLNAKKCLSLIAVWGFISTPAISFADGLTHCVEQLEVYGVEVSSKKAKATISSNGLINYEWKKPSITCIASNSVIKSLIVDNNVLLQDGFPSSEAAELFRYMQQANGNMLSECTARHQGTLETFEQIYLPKLRQPNAKLDEIKELFDDNFSKVSKTFYEDQFRASREPLLRLKLFEELLQGLQDPDRQNPDALIVASRAIEREAKLQTDIDRLINDLQILRSQVREANTSIEKLSAELGRTTDENTDLLDELMSYEKPRRLRQIESSLREMNFSKAQMELSELLKRFKLDQNELNRLEVTALEIVRPIPAADKENNRLGYTFLSDLLPNNKRYMNKLMTYAQD